MCFCVSFSIVSVVSIIFTFPELGESFRASPFNFVRVQHVQTYYCIKINEAFLVVALICQRFDLSSFSYKNMRGHTPYTIVLAISLYLLHMNLSLHSHFVAKLFP